VALADARREAISRLRGVEQGIVEDKKAEASIFGGVLKSMLDAC
jgi:hypothetical protein